MNRVELVGRLCKEPDLRKTSTGKSVMQFTLAVNRRGNEPSADFVQCVAWEKTAELIAKYQHKGSLIGVCGSIATRSYDDSNGKRVFVQEVLVNEVHFLESKKQETNQEAQQQTDGFEGFGAGLDLNPDDLPF